MKKAAFIVLVAAAVGLLFAPEASAQAGIIRWIAKLSGPGDLVGPGYEFFPFCYGKKTGVVRIPEDQPGRAQAVPQPSDEREFDTDLNCRSFLRDGRVAIGGLQVAHLWGHNNQEYASSVPEAVTKRVQALLVMGTVDTGLGHRAFDIGFGAGFMRFYGMPAPAFNHPIYTARLTIRPVAFRNVDIPSPSDVAYASQVLRRYHDDWLQFRVELNIVPGGLSDTDFGAPPGTFPDDAAETSTEASVRFSVAFNFGNAYRW